MKKIKSEGKILNIIKNNNAVKNIEKNDEVIIITNQTPFYGESGGQVGDIGSIIINKNKFKITDTKKILKMHLHFGKVEEGKFEINQVVNMIVDKKTRDDVKIYHSATHLLHASLREVLGNHVTQKGSLVAPDRLRFDFSHPKAINDDEIKKIESTANKIIKQNEFIQTSIMPYKKAVEKGAIALFGEKYDDEVRVVSMGNKNSKFFSMELCGGTHVNKTGDLMNLKIIKQSSVAAGIRRIEALSGNDLSNYIKAEKEISLIREKEKQNKWIAKREQLIKRQ